MTGLFSSRHLGTQWVNDRLKIDVCLLACRFSDISGKLMKLKQLALTAGLKINMCKTKQVLIIGGFWIYLQGELIEQMNTFGGYWVW